MRHINKKISLNSSKSKLPCTLSALAIKSVPDGYYTDFVKFTKDDILSSMTNGNYDLIVSDIEIPYDLASGITDYTDIYVNIPISGSDDYYDIERINYDVILNKYENSKTYYYYYERNIYSIEWSGEYKKYTIEEVVSKSTPHKYLSYASLRSWYFDFKNYYDLLNSSRNNIVYNSAFDYYTYEVKGKSAETDDKYRKLDDTIKSRGGMKMYEWIKRNCIEIYELPKKFRDANKFAYLYYPNALKFFAWLDKMHTQFSGMTQVDCNNLSGDCCDCSEYIKRGGDALYDDISKWILSVKADGNEINSASLSIPLMFTTNIDDLGEMSIFSNEYKERTDYSSTLDYDHKIDGVSGGTVIHRPVITDNKTGNVFVDNNAYMIKDDSIVRKGFIQNKYKENVFYRNDWVDYTVEYINKHTDEFVSNKLYFAYRRDGNIVYNPTNNDMSEHYTPVIFDNGAILYNGNIYEVQKIKYVQYNGLENSLMNGMTFPVEITSDGGYYTKINERFFTAYQKADGNYYFNFTKPNKCHDLSNYVSIVLPKGNDFQRAITLNKDLYLLDDDATSLTITYSDDFVSSESSGVTYEYKIINGYVKIDNITYYIIGRKLYEYEGFASVSGDNGMYEEQVFSEANPGWINNKRYPLYNGNDVEILYPYQKYRTDIVSGHTDSKLHDLIQTNMLIDDLGNEMPGYFTPTSGSSYAQPYEGCLLDMYYKPGNVSQLSLNGYLTEDENYAEQYFDGNILQSMKFYYTIYGKPCDDTVVELTNDMEESAKTNVLSAISQSTDCLDKYIAKSETLSADTPITDLHCVFTYYRGAILHEKIKYDKEKGTYEYHGYELANGMNHGVKYVEDDILTKEKCIYKMLDGNSIYLSYYNINQNQRSITLNDYNNQLENIFDAEFSANIRFFKVGNNDEIEVSRNEFSHNLGFNQLNNMVATPVFRKNYDFGITFSQNVNANIYIDRGINRAFDKHLMLQEIKNMEALENYQNGGVFEIMEN